VFRSELVECKVLMVSGVSGTTETAQFLYCITFVSLS
jgi:hypothetical protein